ncbi:MAG: DUF4923 family protein [Bacteroidaceae bacterium]|nr:DUF4923 family protein [Bacteroidaceae bacterium]
MKRFFIVVALVVAIASLANAQSWKDALGKIAGKVTEKVSEKSGDTAVLGNVLGDLLGKAVPLSESMLLGTWNYQGVACVLESDNSLASLGGSAVAGQLEEKLDGYLSKVGVVNGACSFTFSEDGSCVFKIKEREVKGTYSLNADEKVINFSFLKGKLNIKTYVAYNVVDMNIVFETDKLLALVQKTLDAVSGKMSAISSTSKLGTAASALGTAGKLLENYEGMMLGMELKK